MEVGARAEVSLPECGCRQIGQIARRASGGACRPRGGSSILRAPRPLRQPRDVSTPFELRLGPATDSTSPFRIAGHRLEGLALVDIRSEVPRQRMGIRRRMAGIVEPVGRRRANGRLDRGRCAPPLRASGGIRRCRPPRRGTRWLSQQIRRAKRGAGSNGERFHRVTADQWFIVARNSSLNIGEPHRSYAELHRFDGIHVGRYLQEHHVRGSSPRAAGTDRSAY